MGIFIIGYGIGLLVIGLTIVITLSEYKTGKLNLFKLIAEIAVLVVLPIYGFLLSNDECGAHPFDLSDKYTPIILYIYPLICYFLSSHFKSKFSPIFNFVIPIGLVIGIIYSLLLAIHFAPLYYAGIIVALFGLPLFAPIIALVVLSTEFISLHKYQRAEITTFNNDSNYFLIQKLIKFHISSFWLKFPILLLISSSVIIIIQGILFLFGQRPDSMISMFTESCGFLLSNYQSCSCGGDHYLCSIAANGNKKLVKPKRFGIRQNQKIVVNRQLLIANAFENWLEENTPTIHRIIRKTYDSMGIQVNKWSKKKKIANVIYILMKPLEWTFLIWLYLLDKKPENRIAIQYIPKEIIEKLKEK